MIRHLLKNVWNRKNGYALLGLEFLVCFLIASAVVISGLYSLNNHLRPLGFEYRDVWLVVMSPNSDFPFGPEENAAKEDSVAMQQVYRTLWELDETIAVAEDGPAPFTGSMSSNSITIAGRDTMYYFGRAGDGLAEVLRLDLVAGRWFDPNDNAATGEPVIISSSLARFMFGDEEAVGKSVNIGGNREISVVGVVSDHRFVGPLADPYHFMFYRARLDRPISAGLPSQFLVRVRPGTPRSFEKKLHLALRTAAPGWEAKIATLEEKRWNSIRDEVGRLLLYLALGGALLLMVALGLVGVLWQSVTQRTREIGIRRAAGATRGRICMQFVGEILVLTSVAVAVGAVLVAHSSVLDLFPGVSTGIYAAGLLSAAAVLYLLVISAALYPGWLATQIQPAQALHCE